MDVVSEQCFFVGEGTDIWRLSLSSLLLKSDMVYVTSFGILKSSLTKKT